MEGRPTCAQRVDDRSVEPPAYDPAKAEELLAEAGWYDRDGDGVVDKDGVALEFEFLFPTGNESSIVFGLLLQESLGEIGVKVTMANLEFATKASQLRALRRLTEALMNASAQRTALDPRRQPDHRLG